MADEAIRVRTLSYTYGTVRAVDNLSLSVQIGEVFGFLGHNGAGKTTTIRLLNGVLTPEAGEISVLGCDPRTEGPALRARTGVLTETPSLDERLTAVENLTIYADLYGVPENQVPRRVASVLELFGLSARAGDKVGGYSRGMKQRLALARAFLHEPELLFLDEPTTGLDPIASQEVHDLIRHVSRDEGRTVFLCTHNLVEAQRLCNRVAVIENGCLVAVGTPRELAQELGTELRYTLDIRSDQMSAARAVLERVPTVLVREVVDGDVTIAVRDREAVPDLVAALVREGVRVYAVAPHEISLEDIYMALHSRQEAAG